MSSPSTPIGSVVIPAWNEAAVIGRTLATLQAGLPDWAVHVVVACNGCTDETAEIARRAEGWVTVLDLPPVGKAGAIRAAEAETSVLPRLYLDADVELPGASALAVLDALAEGAVGARPPATYDLAGSSWPVRAYHAERAAQPAFGTELSGAGVYGLSATARGRFGEFPDVVADDLFAARIVDASETAIVDCAPVVVRMPRDVRSLLDTLVRVQRGNRQLERAMPDLVRPTATRTVRNLARRALDPRRWPSVLVFAVLTVAARWRARRASGTWERDDSARAQGVDA